MAGSMDVNEFVAREALKNEDKFKKLVAQLGDSSPPQPPKRGKLACVHREGKPGFAGALRRGRHRRA